MADSGGPIWDLDQPTSNVALERIRLALLATDDAYLLIDMLLGLIDAAAVERQELRQLVAAHETWLEAVTIRAKTAQTGVDELQDKVTALTARLPAPEPPPANPEPTPPAEPDPPLELL